MARCRSTRSRFLSYYPLKQGLKHMMTLLYAATIIVFLSYYPLKQGLKLTLWSQREFCLMIFILLSIKTRIETDQSRLALKVSIGFLSYYPLKQGLKPASMAILE